MSAAVKVPLIRVEFLEGKRRKSFFINKKAAFAVRALLDELSVSEEALVPATDLFPDLADSKKTPGIALRGVRLRYGLTQKQMAEKIGMDQSDISKIESGERAIGKKLALRIGKVLKVDYRRFL